MGKSGRHDIYLSYKPIRECPALQENIKAPWMIRAGLNYPQALYARWRSRAWYLVLSSIADLKNA